MQLTTVNTMFLPATKKEYFLQNLTFNIDDYLSRIKKSNDDANVKIARHKIGVSVSIDGDIYFLYRTNNGYELQRTQKNDYLKHDGKPIGGLGCNADDVIKNIEKKLAKASGHKLDEAGCVYLISDGEHVKIGATSYAVTKRLNELQTGNSRRLSIIGHYEVKNKISTESHLHSKYIDKNILGEWFSLSESDIYEVISQRIDISNRFRFFSLSENDVENIRNAIAYCESEYASFKHKVLWRSQCHKSPTSIESLSLSLLNRWRKYRQAEAA